MAMTYSHRSVLVSEIEWEQRASAKQALLKGFAER
jgi:hypothetical protein